MVCAISVQQRPVCANSWGYRAGERTESTLLGALWWATCQNQNYIAFSEK
jgi:hypothetical protein